MFKNVDITLWIAMIGMLGLAVFHPDSHVPLSNFKHPWYLIRKLVSPLALPIVHVIFNFFFFLVTNNMDEGD